MREKWELEQLIMKYEDGILPDTTILHAQFGRVVWLIDHPTNSVFTLNGVSRKRCKEEIVKNIINDNRNNILFVAPLVETQDFDTPEKRVYTDRSSGKRYTWFDDDLSLVSDSCEYSIKQRHKLITMQLLYEENLDASLKNDHDDNIIFAKEVV